MIKAFLCDELALLSLANEGNITPLLNHIATHNLAFVLLTNPYEHLKVIHKRLSFISSLADVTFTFITHHENSHFERQNPAFFAEILARVGIEPNEALILSPLEDDIKSGRQVGINGFHLTNGVSDITPYFGGWLAFVNLLMREDWQTCYTPIPLTPMMIAPQLTGNIGALQGLLHNIKPEFWHQHPDPQEWSAYQIVCHLLESEQTVQRPRLEKIAVQLNPFISQNTVAPTPQCDFSETEIIDLFYQERQKTLRWLAILTNEVWERPARHSIFGPTTFLEMAHFTAQHDRLHINQLCQTLQKCH